MGDKFARFSVDVNVTPYLDEVVKIREMVARISAWFAAMPKPPAPRTSFDGTAREYRAARRRYSREMRSWKALR